MKSWIVKSKLVKCIFAEFEDCVVFIIDKNIVHLPYHIVLCCTYIASNGSPIYERKNENGIESLINKFTLIESYFGKVSFILAGDLNARVKDLEDYIPEDNLDFRFGEGVDYPGDCFNMMRASRDTECSKFGKSLIEMCRTKNIHFLNGRFRDKNWRLYV